MNDLYVYAPDQRLIEEVLDLRPIDSARSAVRDLLVNRSLTPFRAIPVSFVCTGLPQTAAAEIAAVFGGTVLALPGEPDRPESVEFNRRSAPNLYLPDSDDFGLRFDRIADDAEDLYEDIEAAGGIPAQMFAVLPGEFTRSYVVTGSLLDFYRLRQELGGFPGRRHPGAREAASRFWDALCTSGRYLRDIVEAFEEVQP